MSKNEIKESTCTSVLKYFLKLRLRCVMSYCTDKNVAITAKVKEVRNKRTKETINYITIIIILYTCYYFHINLPTTSKKCYYIYFYA